MYGISCSNDQVTGIDIEDLGVVLTRLPSELATLPGLRKLNLRGNYLLDPTLPAQLLTAGNLTELGLEVAEGVIASLPGDLVGLPLQSLRLVGYVTGAEKYLGLGLLAWSV